MVGIWPADQMLVQVTVSAQERWGMRASAIEMELSPKRPIPERSHRLRRQRSIDDWLAGFEFFNERGINSRPLCSADKARILQYVFDNFYNFGIRQEAAGMETRIQDDLAFAGCVVVVHGTVAALPRPYPTDRGKSGVKSSLLTDGVGYRWPSWPPANHRDVTLVADTLMHLAVRPPWKRKSRPRICMDLGDAPWNARFCVRLMMWEPCLPQLRRQQAASA